MHAKMIKMCDEKDKHEIGNCGFHFHAELKSGFQSLIINDDQNSDV